jgi:hypothetical protein
VPRSFVAIDLGIHLFLNGSPVTAIQLDTTQAATDTIQYVVTGPQPPLDCNSPRCFPASRIFAPTGGQLPMNDTTSDHDQADEDILTYSVSDEALEAAAGTERGVENGASHYSSFCSRPGPC